MAYFDWRETVVDHNIEKYQARKQGVKFNRGKWKQQIVASYIPIAAQSQPVSIPGVLPSALKMLAVVAQLLFSKVEISGKRDQEQHHDHLDIDIGPEEAALVIRDGQILGTYTQKRLASGGFVAWLKSLVGVDHSYRLLIVDLAPFTLDIELNDLVSKDYVKLAGTAHLQMQVALDHVANTLALFRGMDLFHVDDIRDTFDIHLKSRVLVPALARRNALEIRTSREIQDSLQQECCDEVQKYYRDFGLVLRTMTVEWGITAVEEAAIAQRERQDRERLEDDRVEREKRRIEQTHDLAAHRQELDFAAHKKQLARDAELDQLEYQLKEIDRRERDQQRHRDQLQREIAQAQNELEVKKIQIEIDKLNLIIFRA